jgi:hypothetical protein
MNSMLNDSFYTTFSIFVTGSDNLSFYNGLSEIVALLNVISGRLLSKLMNLCGFREAWNRLSAIPAPNMAPSSKFTVFSIYFPKYSSNFFCRAGILDEPP